MDEDELRKMLDQIKSNPDLMRQLYFMLVQYFAEKSDLRSVIDALNQMEKRMEQRFAKIDERFAKVDERFAKVDEHIAQLHAEMNERFAKVDERFAKIDERLDKLMNMTEEIHSYLGGSLEGLVHRFVRRELQARGFRNFVLHQNKTFTDENKAVHPDSTVFEIDLFCQNPLVIVEITSILKNFKKVEDFINKVQVIREQYPNVPIGVIALVATDIMNDLLPQAAEALHKIGAELITKEQLHLRLNELDQ